jgi:hypothetical protein
VQPAFGVERLGRFLGILAIALHHDRCAHQQFPIVEQLQLNTGQRLADRADAVVVGRVHRREAGQL